MSTYTYVDSKDFISDLEFDYVETYSFQRGAEFENARVAGQKEFDQLKAQKVKLNNLSGIEEKKLSELEQFYSYTQYIINENGLFHPSAKKTNTFNSPDPNISIIKNILLTEVIEKPEWLCSPVYRDALVFYNSDNKIIRTLNICLTCLYMETSMFNHVNGDYKTYDLFKRFFIRIGHEVEEPTS